MSYSIEGRDIIFKGFEEGISDNPYEGINDMRGVNIVSVPGEASVSFASSLVSLGSCTGSVTSADSGTDVITITLSTGALASYQAVVFTGGSLPTGITAGTVYWVSIITGTTFTIYNNAFLSGSPVNITATGTGTFATVDLGTVMQFERTTGACIDSNGRCWYNYSGAYVFLGNSLPTGSGGQGIQWIPRGDPSAPYDGYLMIFTASRMSYIRFNGLENTYYTSATWVNEWNPATGAASPGTNTLNTSAGGSERHPTIYSTTDNTMYIGDGFYLDSLYKVKDTATILDLTNTATYVWTSKTLNVSLIDTVQSLTELGETLLIGGKYNVVYPWDKLSVGTSVPIIVAENNIAHMVTVNTNAYIFAGNRGRIYVTNGSQAQLYKKIPDHISGGIDPIYTWGAVTYYKNQIYFGLSTVKNNAQTTITSYSGLWGIDITTDALRVVAIPSTSTGAVTAVFAYPSASATSGYGVYFSWKTTTPTYGIDASTSQTPYTSYGPYIITDMINVGQYLTKKTFENVEFKLSTPLISGEGVKISYRTNLTESFTQVGETTTAGLLSDVYSMNFENVQWIQFKVEQKSTQSSPSYVRLREIRLR